MLQCVLVDLIQELLFLSDDLTDQIQTFTHLVLLDVYVSAVCSDGIKVLLDFKGYLLRQLVNDFIHPLCLEAQISIFHNF